MVPNIMRKVVLAAFLIASLLVASCGGTPATRLNDTGASPQTIAETVAANNQFAVDLYRQLSQEKQNVFFSPWSISSALAMTYEGARGETATQMERALRLAPDSAVRRPAFASLYNTLAEKHQGYQLSTANALWLQKDYPLLPSFTDTVLKYYGGAVTNLDLFGDSSGSAKTINAWVEDQTNKKIKNLVAPAQVQISKLILTNAVYFKGEWTRAFDKKLTQDDQFHVSTTKTVTVKMMTLGRDHTVGYAETNDSQVLELPYKGDEVSMLVILPKEMDGLAKVESSLSAANLSAWRSSLKGSELPVSLPKFKFSDAMLLNDQLQTLGMPRAFSDTADFSGMTGAPDLTIGLVIHKAYVDVNEEGTEAAAATAVIMESTAAFARPLIFRADHPFLFLIVEKRSGSVLFMGKVTDPSTMTAD